ncbi:hypothetical protein [Mogibacterium pumilum]|uniref:X-X-X-Leu-X-X-Gly heptad repeats n=1 Tax=Mogibacterium pumilum TaxID=86332 RepID=A0A223AQT7_9FIRM|nr:hypothetical protein [Mogibacterium pumilum]ASS37330.1 hypothetical protein AXF17_01810 [Mogibacterium pumilum]
MNKMGNHKNVKRGATTLALCLAVGMMYMTGSITVGAASNKNETDVTKSNSTEKAMESSYPNLSKETISQKDKNETTYTSMDADGNIIESVVTEQLANNDKHDSISDYSTLKNIENTSGHEKFSKNGNNIIWDANGKSIKYKGTPTSGLPVNVKITYYLNDKKMTAKEIAGKSGNVTIRFDYTVNQSDIVNGKLIKHPYTVASGVVLNDDNFSDITVSNGKALDDGNKTVVMGVAFPNMNENLGISRSKLDIPNSVIINAHTEKFEIDGTYTAAMSGIANDLNGNLSGVKGKAAKLENSLKKLGQASNKLEQGSKDLKSGADELANGTAKLKSGSSEVLSGANSLNSALQQLTANSASLRNGAAQVEKQIFANATTQLQDQLGDDTIVLSPSTYAKVLAGISDGAIAKAEDKMRSSLSTAGVSDTSTQNNIISLAYNKMMADGKSEATAAEVAQYIQQAGVTAKEAQKAAGYINQYKNAAVTALKTAGYTDEQLASGTGQQTIMLTAVEMGLTGGSTNMETLQAQEANATKLLISAKEYEIASQGASDNVKKLSAIAVGKDVPAKLKSLKEQLDSLEMFIAGVKQYTAGVDAAAAGSSKLVSGLENLNSGIAKLDDGSNKVDAGATQLAAGMTQLNEQGIQKFISTLNKADIGKITSRLEATITASKQEVFVGGKDSSMTGESRLIFKSGEVKVSNGNKETNKHKKQK